MSDLTFISFIRRIKRYVNENVNNVPRRGR